MGLRFHRSICLLPGVRPRGARATVGIPGTGLSYTEQSPWAKSPSAPTASGIEVTELPREEIDIPPAVSPPTPAPELDKAPADDADLRDPRLGPIMFVIVAIIAAAAVLWALLV